MGNYIPDEKIQEIQNAADIVEVVSDAVVLRKTGKNFQGLCPFHAEKTPSFSVNPAKQIFYCFGCGAGGNVFSFVMKKEGLSFPEAVRGLANRYGIAMPTANLTPAQRKEITERDQLFALNRMVKDFFRHNLNSSKGNAGERYLSQRKITKEIIARFELGFALPDWNALGHYLANKRVPSELLEKSGLISPRKTGTGYYDTFRNRITFPIMDLHGKIIGFGGRVMDDSLPKYLNSPETLIYNKRRSLYGIHLAREKARTDERVYVVEGYFDLIALHQHGISNSVATLGTALTSNHVKLLKGLVGKTGKVFLVFDADTAGIRAAERSIDIFSSEFISVNVLTLPDGHDPDSFIFAHGCDAFLEITKNATDAISFLIDLSIKKHGLSLEGRVRIVSELKKVLAAVDDPVAKALYVQTLAERIGIDEIAILENLRSVPHTAHPHRNQQQALKAAEKSTDLIKRISRKNRFEAQIVAMMFQFPDVIPDVRNRGLLKLFDDPALKSIGELIIAYFKTHENPVDVLNQIETADLKNLAASLAIGDDKWDKNGCHRLMDQFLMSRQRHKMDLLKKIKAAEAAEDHEQLMQLLKERQALARKNNSSSFHL